MTRLAFDKALYQGPCVDEAVKVYGKFATFELTEAPEQWVVAVTAADPKREQRICRELANYALGLTITRRQGAA